MVEKKACLNRGSPFSKFVQDLVFILLFKHEECGGQAGRKNQNYSCSTFQHTEFLLALSK